MNYPLGTPLPAAKGVPSRSTGFGKRLTTVGPWFLAQCKGSASSATVTAFVTLTSSSDDFDFFCEV